MATEQNKLSPSEKVNGLKSLFTKHSDADIENILSSETGSYDDVIETYEGGGEEWDNPSLNMEPGEEDDKAKRPEYWYDKIEDTVEENEDRSKRNTNLLNKLLFKTDTVDYRTVWIMRVLIAIFMAIVADVIIKMHPHLL